MLGPGLGHDPLGHLALEHQRQAVPEGRPVLGREPAHQKLGAHVIGQVRGHLDRRREMRERVDLERVAIDHLEPARIGRRDLGQRGQAAAVLLDRENLARALGQKPAREPAGAGPDLEHIRPAQIARRARDFRRQVQIEQKVLPEALLGHEIMSAQNLAQRRQSVDRGHHSAPASPGGKYPPRSGYRHDREPPAGVFGSR